MHSLFVVKVKPTNSDDGEPATIYMMCDKNRAVKKDILFMGITGDPKYADDRRPFILFPDGRVDYGAACKQDEQIDRFMETNLRSKRIEVGELFTVQAPEQGIRESVTTYKIIEVIQLTK